MVIRFPSCAAILLVLMLAFIGCDSGDGSREQFLEAIDKTDSAQSYQMTMNRATYNKEGTLLSLQVYEEKRASNEDYWGRSVLYWYDGNDARDSSYWELIRIGDMIYCRHEENEQWLDCSKPYTILKNGSIGSSVSVMAGNDTNSELQLLRWLMIDEILSGVALDGIECTYYQGIVDMESYMRDRERKYELPVEILENMLKWELTAELWIDGDDYIRQIELEHKFPYRDSDSDDEWHTMSSTIQYSGFSEAISITPPSIE